MSTTEKLSGDKLGRLVAMLDREHFTGDEIKAALNGYEEQEWRTAWLEYRLSHRLHRWDCTQITDAVIRWANENNRWPIHRDFCYANRLPSPNVLHYHNQSYHWCGGERWSYNDTREPHPDIWARVTARAKELSADLVLTIPNQTFRRDAIVAYGGFAEIVKAGGGRQIQQDDYGTLWRLNYAEANVNDFFSLFVEVVNSTANPDGTFDHYFLRVPPTMRTAQDAVAWTGHFEKIRNTLGEPKLGERRFAGFAAQS